MKNFRHFLFDEIFYTESLPSTNKKAENMIRNEKGLGNFLVFTSSQTGGLGRKDNSWYSPEDGLWMTAALYNLPFKSGLTIFTGICIHKAIMDYLNQDLSLDITADHLKIKWPNDIYWKDKKICGILTVLLEKWKYHIVGIGINTNNTKFTPELEDTAAALNSIFDYEINNLVLMERIFDRISKELPAFIEDTIDMEYYNRHSFLLHQKIELDTDFDKFQGVALGINKFGALLLKMESGMIQPFYAGTVKRI